MKKIFLISAAALLLASCDKVEDNYYGKTGGGTSGPSLDDTGIDWPAAADYGTTKLVDFYWNTGTANGFPNDNLYHFTVGSKGTGKDANNNYWVQAHAFDVIVDAYLRTGDTKYKDILDKGYRDAIGDGSTKSGKGVLWTSYGGSAYSDISKCFGNPFIDDMEWHALTLIRMFEATEEAIYLTEAQKLFDQIWTLGWDPKVLYEDDYFKANGHAVGGEGGFVWSYSSNDNGKNWSKNACSNNPGCLVAARLYQMSQRADYEAKSLPRYRDEDYLLKAKKSYNWIRSMIFNQQTGMIYGGVSEQKGVDKAFALSYDQGTFIGSAHLLYQFTGDKGYMNDAAQAAYYSMNSGVSSNGILRDEGPGGDNGTFKGIFVRYAVEFVNDRMVDKGVRIALYDFLKQNAIMLWKNGTLRNEAKEPVGLFTPDWTKNQEEVKTKGGDYFYPLLGWQTSGATLMEAMCVLKDPRK